MVRIAMKNVNKRFEPEVSPAKAGLLSIDPKLVLHSSLIIIIHFGHPFLAVFFEYISEREKRSAEGGTY